jgi:hypothetical protein
MTVFLIFHIHGGLRCAKVVSYSGSSAAREMKEHSWLCRQLELPFAPW